MEAYGIWNEQEKMLKLAEKLKVASNQYKQFGEKRA